MEFFRIRKDIPFMRHALVLNVISFLTFAAAVFFLFTRGLYLSIEFTGGTVLGLSIINLGRCRRIEGCSTRWSFLYTQNRQSMKIEFNSSE